MEAAGRPHFGALLRQFRLDAGITQQELAERAKLSVEAISTLERGARTRPRRDTVVLLGRALELSPEREALLGSAIGIAHPSLQRERSESLSASLLRIVSPDAYAGLKHNLSRQLTSYIGRQGEIAEMAALLSKHPLVTVVGAGGVGKTRFATQIGSLLLDGCPDGVWLVDLAPLADQTLVASAVLTALKHPSTTGNALDAMVAYLKARRLLIILDNCEHVIGGAREVAASIMQSCPYVHILSTSREALGVNGERVFRLPSLAVPPNSRGSAQAILQYGAVALFVDRALTVDASFVLTDENAPHVAAICRYLDGIPLAIELAAARVTVLTPHQIAERLGRSFHLLTASSPGGLRRHQTMTALIDWSYGLLTPREQRFFEWLSVFAGGCTLEAATSVCATDGEDELAVIDLIASLVTKSLLVAELADNEQRYRLLESSRQYGRGKLIARGEQEQAAKRHALIYLELAEQLERACDATPESAVRPRAKAELGNWRAALGWALEKQGDVILGQRLAAARRVMWRSFTQAEARRWVRTALEMVDELTPPHLVAQLEYADAFGAAQFGERNRSLAAAERALVRYRALGDRLGVAWAQRMVGGSLVSLGRFTEGEALLREVLAAARALSHRRLEVAVLHKIGVARTGVDDFVGARTHLTEAFELADFPGSESFAIGSDLAVNEFYAGDPETALRLFAEVLSTHGARNSAFGSSSTENISETNIATILVNMAECLVALGRYDEARVQANEALEFARASQLDVHVAMSLQHLALAAMRPLDEGRRTRIQYAGAARLLGFVEAFCNAVGTEGIGSEYDNAVALLREAIGADKLAFLMSVGAKMTEDEAVAQARELE